VPSFAARPVMGAASGALSQAVFNTCGFIPDSPCGTTSYHNASASSNLSVEGRDIADADDYQRRQAQQRKDRSWLFCSDEDQEVVEPEIRVPAHGGHKMVTSAASSRQSEASLKLEPLVKELFELQDLNKNGVLEEDELIKLNQKIAMLHHGKDTDSGAVKKHYKELFRSKLDPNGDPVPFSTFRGYMMGMLDEMDRDKVAQELIMEQFIAEARSGRVAFHCPSFQSVTDQPYRSKIEDQAPWMSARGATKAGA